MVVVVVTGTLHVGDEIREINGISVANQTVEQLQKMLVSPSSDASQASTKRLASPDLTPALLRGCVCREKCEAASPSRSCRATGRRAPRVR